MGTENYSEEVQKFLEENAEQTNIPKLLIPKVRLHGKEGKFYIRERLENGKFAEEEKPFGPDTQDRFGAVILKPMYFCQWKYKENAAFRMQTREFASFTGEPIELLKITFGENGKTEVLRTFPDYQAFKAACIKHDELSGEALPAPYDLHCSLYLWHLSRKETIKYSFKGSTVSNWFDFTKKWSDFFPEAKAIFQIKTGFGLKQERNEKASVDFYTGTFSAHSICTDEEMHDVMKAYKAVKDWQDAWKAQKSTQAPKIESSPLPEALPTIQAEGEETEINLDDIPF